MKIFATNVFYLALILSVSIVSRLMSLVVSLVSALDLGWNAALLLLGFSVVSAGGADVHESVVGTGAGISFSIALCVFWALYIAGCVCCCTVHTFGWFV